MRVELDRELTTLAPFDAAAVHAYLQAHATPGRDTVEPGVLGQSAHALDVAGGLAIARVSWAQLSEADGWVRLPLNLSLPSLDDEVEATAILRRMFDLDADPALITRTLSHDPLLAPLLAQRPGLRLPGSRNAAESALGTVLGQQVSLAAARTLQGRLATMFQTAVDSEDSELDGWCGAPDVTQIAAIEVEELRSMLGLTQARARTLQTVATALRDGLDLTSGMNHSKTRAELLALRGIGPWSVEIIALRVLGDRDAYPAGDLILRRALDVRTDREAQALAESWSPFRGYATQHLWADFLEAQAAQRLAK